jgi:hypothetical protein
MIRRNPVLALGFAMVLAGCLWIGQGLGMIQWPASGFMLDQRPWALRGAGLAALGVILIVLVRRR